MANTNYILKENLMHALATAINQQEQIELKQWGENALPSAYLAGLRENFAALVANEPLTIIYK